MKRAKNNPSAYHRHPLLLSRLLAVAVVFFRRAWGSESMASASASDLEQRAKEAFVDDNFDLAVDLYSQAIDLHPSDPVLFADRSQANIKLSNFTEAVADANKAIQLDPSISKAYLRKGVACMKLEEYHTAKAALETGASLTAGDSRLTDLIRVCNERIAEESNELKAVEENVSSAESVPTPATSEDANVSIVEREDMPIPVTSSKPLYRHEFYQKPEEIVVTVFAKGIPAQNVAVEFGEQIMSVTINSPGGELYHLQPRLFGKIIPEKCRFLVLSTKIEIRLYKAEAIHWSSLEFSTKSAVPQKLNTSSGIAAQRPTYPSSKSKRTDWDKLEAKVKKEEKDEKLDGDAALNKLFRDIYRDADEDTRRAMQKSFVESNGTVLSTNWKEVGAKTVDGSPPDGMEMRKWEY